jgi:hypothetical protein
MRRHVVSRPIRLAESNNGFRLERLADGASGWSEKQSR